MVQQQPTAWKHTVEKTTTTKRGFLSSVKKCLKIKENERFSKKFLMQNHYEVRSCGLSDLF